MKPTYQQIEDLVHANTALGENYNKVIQSGGQDSVSPVPYRFGAKSKEVRQAAAHNLRVLRPLLEEYTDLKNSMLMEITEGRGHIERSEGGLSAKYNMKLRDLQRTAVKAELLLEPIAEEDLNLAQNPIPPHVVATLSLIVASEKATTDA